MERQKQELSENWNMVYQEISVNKELPQHYLEKFPRLFSFGYSLGYQISEILGGQGSENHEAGVISALFNMYASLFDEICDNYPHLVSRLIEIVNVKSLAKAIDADEKLGMCIPLAVSDRDDILLRTVCMFMNQYFTRCRIQKPIKNRMVYEEFQSLILDLYKRELQSLQCTFTSNTNSADIYRILFTKSALPSWTIFLTSFMCLKREPKCNFVELKNAIVGLGKAIWIIDDLSDVFEDLDRNRWSYVWLKFHFEHGVPLQNDGRVRDKTELCEDLLATNAVSDSATEMCKNLVDSFALLRCYGYNVSKFEQNILVWINSWIG